MAKKIPKIIHCAWFGGGEKPDIIKKCQESWRKILPDYEIMEWNENNFDLSKYPFAQEAFNRKRYAFVSDIVRLVVLLEFGGIYMDSDVEVVKPFRKFLEHRAFTGHETNDLMVTATMGAEKGHPWIKLLLDYYTDRQYSEKTNTQIITEMSRPLIVKENQNGYRWLKDDVVIYPREYFCNFNHQTLEIIPHANAHAYHRFAGSWTSRGHK